MQPDIEQMAPTADSKYFWILSETFSGKSGKKKFLLVYLFLNLFAKKCGQQLFFTNAHLNFFFTNVSRIIPSKWAPVLFYSIASVNFVSEVELTSILPVFFLHRERDNYFYLDVFLQVFVFL